MAIRMTKVFGDAGVQNVGVDRLEDQLSARQSRPASTVSRMSAGLFTLGVDPLNQLVGLRPDPVDLDPGCGFEIAVQPLVGVGGASHKG